MSLNLIPATQQILNQVEDLTKKKFKFIERDNLPCFAKVKAARKNMSQHIIFYKKAHDDIINHLIAHECGHVIRIFNAPESKRVMPFTNQEHLKIIMSEMKKEIEKISLFLQGIKIEQLLNIWINGLVTQLTNFPPDLMIEKWLYDNYPELREYQFDSIKRQWNEAIAGVADKVKAVTPAKIFISSNVMNYAFYQIISSYLNYDFLKPYDSTPFKIKGKKLADLTEHTYKNDFEGDVTKINEWANFLDLSRWFSWTDFENIPNNYEETV